MGLEEEGRAGCGGEARGGEEDADRVVGGISVEGREGGGEGERVGPPHRPASSSIFSRPATTQTAEFSISSSSRPLTPPSISEETLRFTIRWKKGELLLYKEGVYSPLLVVYLLSSPTMLNSKWT